MDDRQAADLLGEHREVAAPREGEVGSELVPVAQRLAEAAQDVARRAPVDAVVSVGEAERLDEPVVDRVAYDAEVAEEPPREAMDDEQVGAQGAAVHRAGAQDAERVLVDRERPVDVALHRPGRLVGQRAADGGGRRSGGRVVVAVGADHVRPRLRARGHGGQVDRCGRRAEREPMHPGLIAARRHRTVELDELSAVVRQRPPLARRGS